MKKKKHKWKYQVNIRKKILVLVILGVFLFVGLGYAAVGTNLSLGGTIQVTKYDRTLYSALKREVDKGYALKYTGDHQDSMDPTKSTEDIYHFYADTAVKGTDILNKNNVVFAGKCWQMIRTTDTGGVKLLYNGDPEITTVNNKTQYNCGDTRNLYQPGGILSEQNLNGTAVFAKNYTATTTNVSTTFTLVDDPDDPDDCKSITIDSTNAASQIAEIAENYPYFCNTRTKTCTNTRLYKVVSQSNGTIANVYNTTYRDRIGNSAFNISYASPTYVGYMYGDVYTSDSFLETQSENFVTNQNIYSATITLGTTYYYADSYDYGITIPDTYTLTNATQITENTDYSTLVGKYVINGAMSGNSIDYIIGIDEENVTYVKTLTGGSTDVSIVLSNTITDNGNNTATLDNPTTTVELKNWYTNYANYAGQYTCGDSTITCSSPKFIGTTTSTSYGYIDDTQTITLSQSRNGLELTNYVTITKKDYFNGYDTTYSDYVYTCGNADTTCTKTNLKYITNKTSTGYTYLPNHNFGASVRYENNQYVLENSVGLEAGNNLTTLSTHHYTCLGLGDTECSSVVYVYYYDQTGTGNMHYVTLNDPNVTSIDTVLSNMFTKNTNSSNIKNKIDAWYEANLKNTIYESKLDDTIFCNDRSFRTTGTYTLAKSGWNANGGSMKSYLYFNEITVTRSLSCTNITDRFSVSNNDAKLAYKIGLATSPEMNMLNQNNARISAYSYRLSTPYNFGYVSSGTRTISTEGSQNAINVGSDIGVRPMISLISGTSYSSGNGEMTNPYIVDMSN